MEPLLPELLKLLFTVGAAYGGVKQGLNGLKADVKEVKSDVKELKHEVTNVDKRVVVLETKGA